MRARAGQGKSKADLVGTVRAELRRLTTEVDGVDARAAAFFGTNRTDQRCIDIVASQGPLTATQLAQVTSLTSGGLTVALDRLERAGLVRRLPNPDDRRSVLIEATEETRRLGREFFGPLARQEQRLLERYDTEQLEAMREFLHDLANALAHHPNARIGP
jgi:DNA-binding MarR family transcriptional regulator